MKFNEVIKEIKEIYGYDTGVTDRGKTGFPSDIHILTRKEITGVKSKKATKKWKNLKTKNNGSQKISEV